MQAMSVIYSEDTPGAEAEKVVDGGEEGDQIQLMEGIMDLFPIFLAKRPEQKASFKRVIR